jgi:hypothetical protein
VHETLDAAQGEDAFVDLKSELPANHRKCARQIAALCNAARGDDAFWLVGVRGDKTVIGIADYDLQDWWPKVRRWFDEVSPDMTDLAIPRADGLVLALCFSTDRAPFVVKSDGQAVEREVPWRDGTTTRSANRNEIMRMLAPVRRFPNLEVVSAMVVVRDNTKSPGIERPQLLGVDQRCCHVALYTELFADTADAITFPVHRQSSQVCFSNWPNVVKLDTSFSATGDPDAPARITPGALQLKQPCLVNVNGDAELWVSDHEWNAIVGAHAADFQLDLSVVGSERTQIVRGAIELERPRVGYPRSQGGIVWSFGLGE